MNNTLKTHIDLSFSSNPCSELESKVPEPNKLLSLDLTSSGLQQLPSFIAQATQLKKLSLGMNPLDPQSLHILSALPHLEILDLQRT
ncbi:MAG: hypothetical protein P1V97_26495, partial [Planctomycetota bacterium]|nr:hypothetical protein [Planctomycetota bacterium]